MTINLKEMIRSQAECNELNCTTDYSGRFMYGKMCIGVIGTPEQCQQLVAELASELMTNVFEYSDEDEDTAYDYHDEAQQALSVLMDYKTDNMGRSFIFYWPDLQTDE